MNNKKILISQLFASSILFGAECTKKNQDLVPEQTENILKQDENVKDENVKDENVKDEDKNKDQNKDKTIKNEPQDPDPLKGNNPNFNTNDTIKNNSNAKEISENNAEETAEIRQIRGKVKDILNKNNIKTHFGEKLASSIEKKLEMIFLGTDSPENREDLAKELDLLISKHLSLSKDEKSYYWNFLHFLSLHNYGFIKDFLVQANKYNLTPKTMAGMLMWMQGDYLGNPNNLETLFELVKNDNYSKNDVYNCPGNIAQYFVKIMRNCAPQSLTKDQLNSFSTIARSNLEVLSKIPTIHKLTLEQIRLFDFTKSKNAKEEIYSVIVNKLILGEKYTQNSIEVTCYLNDLTQLVLVP